MLKATEGALAGCPKVIPEVVRSLVVKAATAPAGPERFEEIKTALQKAINAGATKSAVELEFNRYFSQMVVLRGTCARYYADPVAYKAASEQEMMDQLLGIKAVGGDVSVGDLMQGRLHVLYWYCKDAQTTLDKARKILQEAHQ